MHIAMRLVKEADTNIGLPSRLESKEHGIVGALFVFETREAAEAAYGPDVETVEVQLKE